MSLIKCPECGKEVSSSAVNCPSCGHPISAVNKTTVVKEKKKGSCLSKILSFFLVIFIVVMILALTDDSEESTTSTNNASVQEETEPTYIKVTSTELIDTFNNNQVKCKQLYDNQLLEVTGAVASIGTDVLDQTYICLGHETEFTIVGIQCYATNKDTIAKISELQVGDTVTVRGKGDCGSMSFSLNKIEIVE